MRQVYLDHQAATPLLPEAFEAMKPYFTEWFGNASSLHQHGLRVRDALKQARRQIAALINADSEEEIFFTSDGTESSNLAIKGVAYANERKGKHLVVSATEHPSIINSVEFLEKQGWTCTRVGVDRDGIIKLDELQAALTPQTVLVAVHHVNHDIGTIQPIVQVGRICAEKAVPLYVDCEASAGWLPVDVKTWGAAMVSFSPHRFYGPKGVGVLYRNKKARLVSIIHGGVQEGGRRAGTENIPAIVGAGVAAEVALRDMAERIALTTRLQRRLWDGLKTRVKYIKLNGPEPGPKRISTNLNLSTEFIEGEGQLLLCDLNGIAVASGSSCVSKSLKISHVLAAIGLDHALAQGNIIMTLGRDTTEADVDYVVETFAKIVEKLRGMSPMWDEFERGIIDSVIAPTGRGKSFSEHAADVSGKAAH
ncbi:MAG TPA: cysteine desulfurase family protein [Verrucomicrobiota bacterium]|nr:cysteine desulfurase NifS [Verrucomicrobiales bacterium]HRI13947.1 cysteine desulfurase family protein [Verrucomicrobiota bacterium]